MFSAQAVADSAYLVIAALVGMVMLMVGEADRIKNQMVVNMPLINMGGKYKLVLSTQYFFCQLQPNLMGFLWRHLPRLKGLDQVAAQVRALVNGMSALSLIHILQAGSRTCRNGDRCTLPLM